MDPRKNRSKDGYNELKAKLSELGYYIDGMPLNEMRIIMAAIEISRGQRESETSFSEAETQRAARVRSTASTVGESAVIDVVSPHANRPTHSSTVMSVNPNASPSSSSMEMPPEIIRVRPEIHRSMQWSPTVDSLRQKRPASDSIETESDTTTSSEKSKKQESSTTESSQVSYKKLGEESSTSESLRAAYKLLDEKPSTSQSSQRSLQKSRDESSTRPLLSANCRTTEDAPTNQLVQVSSFSSIVTEESYNTLHDVDSLESIESASIANASESQDSEMPSLEPITGTSSSGVTGDLGTPTVSIDDQEIYSASSGVHCPFSLSIPDVSDVTFVTESASSSAVLGTLESTLSSSTNRAEQQQESDEED